ncbi:LPXTG cell wall anchor domain-containing protein [uncultured Microbacterium sp.]|uniref:DUF7927 domain-containing protein n=1 Tax=uncultured Microbacterium sp. TaxID=191216 RepID=UPI002625ED7F|nr:LPXTG cell wall anchor domain-containing protein [uncultured Microbacterium sp.]
MYANETGGTYKDNLCWLDMSYTNSAGQKVPITTEYQQVGATQTTCSSEWSWWNGYVYTCTTTMAFASVLGAEYGSLEISRTGSSSTNEQTARSSSVTAAQNVRAATLQASNGLYYGSVTGFPISVALSEGAYTFNAKIDIFAPAATPAQEVRGYGFPTWSGAFLGNNSFYVVPPAIRSSVYPALYQGPSSAGGGTTTVTLRDIQVLNGTTPFAGYSVVVADAESTDEGETLTWSQSGGQGFRWLPNDPAAYATATGNARRTAAVGNACSGTNASNWPASLVASNPVTCSATGSSTKTGTAMLQALPPANGSSFSVTQAMKGNGLQAVAFGLLTSRASVTVNVADRILGVNGAATAGTFDATVSTSGNSAVVATAQTGEAALTATRSLELPVTAGGAQLRFASSTTAPFASSYVVAWACSKTGGGAATTWPAGGGTSATPPSANDPWFVLQPSAFINCTVTYTPPYLTLVKSVDNGETGATNVPADFTLTAQRAGLSSTSVGGAAAVKKPVAVGTYDLTESGPTNGGWPYGYDWRALTCVAASGAAPTVTTTKDAQTTAITAATVAIAAGRSVTCTYGNVALVPKLVIGKSVDPASGTLVDPGQVVTYTLTFDNRSGTSAAPVNHVDHLRDVLDDSVLNTSSIRYGTSATAPPGSMTPAGVTATVAGVSTTAPTLTLVGSVPRAQIRVISFTVTVKANATDAAARSAAAAPLRGFVLQNYLTAVGAQPPSTCAAPPVTAPATCTINEIRATTIVLPLTGGSGWVAPALVGGIVVLVALAAALFVRRRRSTRP